MNELEKLIQEFNKKNPDPCWYYNEEMRECAGALAPCEPNPGTTCPACNKSWAKK